MEESFISQATKAFKEGRYLEAYDYYVKAGRISGMDTVDANLRLCLKKHASGNPFGDLPLHDLKVACIMDTFTWHSYKYECNLLQLTPDNAIKELEDFQPHLLFVESAWDGKDKLWHQKVSHLSQELQQVLNWCKEKHIPRLFWSKEDPVHFTTFLMTAKECDFVLTTDIDCIAEYKKFLNHERVFLLPFAFQPSLNNPIERYKRQDTFCFAGSYYSRYPERAKNLENFIQTFSKYHPVAIYDRNYKNNMGPGYQFPEEYQNLIRGTLPFEEIDKAYKGYNYAINMNSIKQSQTMFARRVYELLASNTLTFSNYSPGVRLLFDDLVFCSDSGAELMRQLESMDDLTLRKLRLAGLRKVLSEHCYEDRIAYIVEKILGRKRKNPLPDIVAMAVAKTTDEIHNIFTSFSEQSYSKKRLILFVLNEEQEKIAMDIFEKFYREHSESKISVYNTENFSRKTLKSLLNGNEWITLLRSSDWYGKHYLLDLALATRYTPVPIIGKSERWQNTQSGLTVLEKGSAYHLNKSMPLRRCLVHASQWQKNLSIKKWLEEICSEQTFTGLSIDPFNYCENGVHEQMNPVLNEPSFNIGMPIEKIFSIASTIKANEGTQNTSFKAQQLATLFSTAKQHPLVKFELENDELVITSTLKPNEFVYFYSKYKKITELPDQHIFKSWMRAIEGLNARYLFLFRNGEKRDRSKMIPANVNFETEIPEGADSFCLGLRVQGSGSMRVRFLEFNYHATASTFLHKNDILMVTNFYPDYDDLYKHGFVHRRVLGYREQGVGVDIFLLHPESQPDFREFQDIDVMTGNAEALTSLLTQGHYKKILVHFLDKNIWQVLQKFPDLPKFVWVHGAEIQPWQRRAFDYTTKEDLDLAKRRSNIRVAFWRPMLENPPKNMKFIFVSHYFANEVMEDYCPLPQNNYAVIHNIIDTDLFSYSPKTAEQRKKILSIRSYASPKYGNDLSVAAILHLSHEPFFADLSFKIVGDGKLFETTVSPLRQFPNVHIEQRFITHQEIADLQKESGVLLISTRWDSQGVSCGEAMSSGLVPVTNAVAAVPEFVDKKCGILAPAEDAVALAEGIKKLYLDPNLFLKMSKAAAERVRRQCGKQQTIEKELELLA